MDCSDARFSLGASMDATNGSRCDDIDFHHPFTPYNVQLQLMKEAYNVLDKGAGQIGILESPTGTGKSLSLICASMTWLRNAKRKEYEESLLVDLQESKYEPRWIIDQMLKRKREELVAKWEAREARLAKLRQKEKRMEECGNKRRRLEGPKANFRKVENDEDAEFLLDEWTENEDGNRWTGDDDPLSGLSKETRALLQQVGRESVIRTEAEEETPDEGIKVRAALNHGYCVIIDRPQIYYASRTHSQLTQFIAELRRPTFPPSLPEDLCSEFDPNHTDGQEPVKHIPLSSRQRLCINPVVSKLGSVAAINDKCSELQKPKAKESCPFVPNDDNIAQTHRFRDAALATLPDIEDMFNLGQIHQVCPYYASRKTIPAAEIITLPYPLLLQKSARNALGIKLEGNVVIVDEAHNIMDAIASVHAAVIRLSELKRARQMLGVYFQRFGKKLKGENRIMVAQVVKVIDGLKDWLTATMGGRIEHGLVDPKALTKSKNVDQINFYKLIKYIQSSKLAFKVESYASHVEDDGAGAESSASSPVLHTLVSFMAALTNLSDEGRIFYEKFKAPSAAPDIKLSYLLLSPTHAFSSIAKAARAVILAGGTMSPFSDYKNHLFPYLSPEKITTLSCSHVIPASNLCVWTLTSTKPNPTDANDVFEFSYQRRSQKGTVKRLGQSLLNVCSVVPDGVVVFFPSYGYLDEVVTIWQAQEPSDSGKSIWDRLQTKKPVFRETKGGSSDDVLQAYSRAIFAGSPSDRANPTRRSGALLLSVVGGTLSEGINFADRLGRCVLMVGLPYPNLHSPEWTARIEYIEAAAVKKRNASPDEAKQVAREFYENTCMRAVNQSIGRVIRHRGDYAAIVLVDRRFGTARIKEKLPGWIRGGLVEGSEGKGLMELMGALNIFFKGRKGIGT